MPENDVAGYQGPDYDEVRGFEAPPELSTVPVSIDEPVNIRELPAVDAQIVSRTVGTSTATKLVSANEFRGRCTLVADDDIYLAHTKGEAEAATGKIPAGTALELRAPVEYYAQAVTAQTTVTLILDSWTW